MNHKYQTVTLVRWATQFCASGMADFAGLEGENRNNSTN
jgi:hypothetical protein